MITNAQLRTELFTDTASSKTLAYDAIKALCSGKFQRTQTQRYIRSEIIDLLVTKRLLAIAAKKNKGKK
jgi:hypothetical protein